MMKTLLLALALLPSLAWPKTIPENVTNTAQDTSSVDVTKNVPFGVGTDGRDHRFAVSNAGEMKVVGGTTYISVSTKTAYKSMSITGVTIGLTYSAGAYAMSITFAASAANSQACQVCFGSTGPSPAFYYMVGAPGYTGVIDWPMYVSTGPLCFPDLARDSTFYLSPTAQGATVTVRTNFFGLE